MKQRFYPAVLERDDGLFAVWFPDFPGCVAAAGSQEEVMAKAHDVLARGILEVAERDGRLPEPTPFEAIRVPEGCDFLALFIVAATPPDPSERVNVYLSKSLIERVDRTASSWGMSRSSFFGLAVVRLLNGWSEAAAPTPIRAKRA